MKILFLSTLATCAMLQAGAAVLRINNTTGSAAPYSSLQTAITAASAGDTLYVEGSINDYGYVTLAKRLNIIGSGYFLAETPANPKTQANPASSTLSGLVLNPGSKGSVIQGFTLGSTTFNDSLVTVQRNRIVGTVSFASSNSIAFDTLRDNYLTSYMSYNNGTTTATGLLIYNNIYTYSYILEVNASNMNLVSGYFINNSFPLGSNTFKCVGFVFQNNIFGSNPDFQGYVSSNSFFYNVTSSVSGIPPGNNNMRGVNGNSLYLSTTSTAASSDGKYQLQSGSPAASAGYMNGTAVDCGAFGGPAPYILSGMPSIPSIYSLSAPAQVAHGTSSINVTLSSAAH